MKLTPFLEFETGMDEKLRRKVSSEKSAVVLDYIDKKRNKVGFYSVPFFYRRFQVYFDDYKNMYILYDSRYEKLEEEKIAEFITTLLISSLDSG